MAKKMICQAAMLTGLCFVFICGYNTDFQAPTPRIITHQHASGTPCQSCKRSQTSSLKLLTNLSDEVLIVAPSKELANDKSNDHIVQFSLKAMITKTVSGLKASSSARLIFLQSTNAGWVTLKEQAISSGQVENESLINLLSLDNKQVSQEPRRDLLVANLKLQRELGMQQLLLGEINSNDKLIALLTEKNCQDLITVLAQIPASSNLRADCYALLLRAAQIHAESEESKQADNIVSAVFLNLKGPRSDKVLPALASILPKIPSALYSKQVVALLQSEEQKFNGAYLISRIPDSKFSEMSKSFINHDDLELASAPFIALAGKKNNQLDEIALDFVRSHLLAEKVSYQEGSLSRLVHEREVETKRFDFVRGEALYNRAVLFYLCHSPKASTKRWLKTRYKRLDLASLQAFVNHHLTSQWASFDSAW